jgi:hypothetical protein
MTWEAKFWAAAEVSESSVRVFLRESGVLFGMPADRVTREWCMSKKYQTTRKFFSTSSRGITCDPSDSGRTTLMILGVLTGLRLEVAQGIVLLLLVLLLCVGFFLVFREDDS